MTTVKKFNLDLVTLPKIKRKNIDGKRYYFQEGVDKPVYYPSVTTVLSADKESKKALHEWRQRVGAAEANKIGRMAAARGTTTHDLIERYVKDDGFEEAYRSASPLGQYLFGPLRDFAERSLGTVRCIEGQLFSHHLRTAGTVDMVAKVDGKLSVVDWKSSLRAKKKEHIHNYFKQEAAYAVMFEEMTKIPVPQIVTAISSEEGEFQLFIEKRDDWIDGFIELRETLDDC